LGQQPVEQQSPSKGKRAPEKAHATEAQPAQMRRNLRSDQRAKPERQRNMERPMRVARQTSEALRMRLVQKRAKKRTPDANLRKLQKLRFRDK
jgi:hypothetical protein